MSAALRCVKINALSQLLLGFGANKTEMKLKHT